MDFIDTNVVVYANDKRDIEKQKRALEIMEKAFRERSATISQQVLQEYANTALKKLNQSPQIVLRQLVLLEELPVIFTDAAMVRRAVEMTSLYGVSFWDAGILAAAEKAGCNRILSEDLNTGQSYGTIMVENPF